MRALPAREEGGAGGPTRSVVRGAKGCQALSGGGARRRVHPGRDSCYALHHEGSCRRVAMSQVLQCPGCGQLLQAGDEHAGQKVRCPRCGAVTVVPVPAAPAGSYEVVEPTKACPNCGKDMPSKGILCIECGYNLKTGRQAETVVQPLERHWEGALPLLARLVFFGLLEMLCVPLFLGDWRVALALYAIFTVIWALCLGTFGTASLTRTPKG